jgi:hypothetical protein
MGYNTHELLPNTDPIALSDMMDRLRQPALADLEGRSAWNLWSPWVGPGHLIRKQLEWGLTAHGSLTPDEVVSLRGMLALDPLQRPSSMRVFQPDGLGKEGREALYRFQAAFDEKLSTVEELKDPQAFRTAMIAGLAAMLPETADKSPAAQLAALDAAFAKDPFFKKVNTEAFGADLRAKADPTDSLSPLAVVPLLDAQAKARLGGGTDTGTPQPAVSTELRKNLDRSVAVESVPGAQTGPDGVMICPPSADAIAAARKAGKPIPDLSKDFCPAQ